MKADKKKVSWSHYFAAVVILLLIAYWIFTRWENKKEKEKEVAAFEQKMYDNDRAMLKSHYNSFISDSGDIENESSLNNAMRIISIYPDSKEAGVCMLWLKDNRINYDSLKAKQDSAFESIKKKEMDAYQRKVEEYGTQPAGDELHFNAFYTAKQFVEDRLKAPATADFSDDYTWGRTAENTYVITSTVDAENSFGAKLRHNWRVKLKLVGDNWTLLDIQLTER